jgi:C-terminal processing protease CtpA/Prc
MTDPIRQKFVFFTLGFLLLGGFVSGCVRGLQSRSPLATSKVMNFTEFQVADVGQASAAPAAPGCGDQCQNRRQEFRYVVYVGKEIYSYWDYAAVNNQTDFVQLAATLENEITDSTSSTDYYLILRNWASSLQDGHVNVMTNSANDSAAALEVYSAPIRVQVLAPATDHEKVIVSAVDAGVQGIKVGDEITAVNGVAVHDALTVASQTLSSGSTERMRRWAAGSRIVDALGAENGSQPFVVTVNPLAGGSPTQVTLYRNAMILAAPVAGASPSAPDTGASLFSVRILPNSIGYFRLDGFTGSQDEALIEEAMDRLADTKGLILDLRKNGGGDLSGNRIIERLISAATSRYKTSVRLSDYLMSQEPSVFNLTPDPSGLFSVYTDVMVQPNKKSHYAGPVVALISPNCFSACDTFSAGLKGNKLATFVGESTGGGTGTPLVFDLPYSGLQFRYSVSRGQTVLGVGIEGIGTAPDFYVEPTVQDIAHGTDGQLQTAVAVVMNLINTGVASTAAPAVPVDLSGVANVWSQDFKSSPTLIENDFLVRIGKSDEM